MSDGNNLALRAKIHDKLIESGEYDRVSSFLRQRLQASGWYDEVKELATNQIMNEEEPNFQRTSRRIEPKALAMVPDEVKLEALKMIKKFLEETTE